MASLKTGTLAEPTLVGRNYELEELTRYLNSAFEGKGTTVFISGEAGSGKTRLTKELLKRAEERGVTTLTGWCLSNAAVPYFPFFEAFNAYFTAELGEENEEAVDVKDWLKGSIQAEKAGKPQAISPHAWKDQTFAAVAKTLKSISAKKPIILFIDDVHWADSASLALIHYIARVISSERILLLATFRSEQLPPDAEGRPHPLVETLRLMRRDDLFKEIKLTGLSQTGVLELAKNMLDGGLQQQFAEKLVEESQGNPLFIVESLRMLCERSALFLDQDQWRFTSGEIGIPLKIKDIVLQRLGALSRNQRRVLEAASIMGEKFNAELLASLLSQNYLEVIETLDAIQKDTSLVISDGSLYRFDHARSRDAIYDEVSPALKRGYHAKVAEKLESVISNGKLPFSEVAYHYAQAENKEMAVRFALLAGQDALARWSNTEAIKHFTYVLHAARGGSERPEERLIALEGLGDGLLANSMFKESMQTYELLSDGAAGVVKLRAFRKAMDAAFQLGDSSHLMELVKKAEPYAAADRLENARVLMGRARGFHLQSNPIAAGKDSETALHVFEEEYSLWDVGWALIGLGYYHSLVFGKIKEGLTDPLRAAALFEELGDFSWQMEACWVSSLGLMEYLLWREALEMLAKVIEIDERMNMGDNLRLVYAHTLSARCFEGLHNYDEALAYSLKALELSVKTDAMIAKGGVYSNLVVQYTKLGNLKQAEEYFEKLMKLPPEIVYAPVVRGRYARTVFFVGKNHWKESNQIFSEFFNVPFKEKIVNTVIVMKQEYALALERQGRLKEAAVLLEESQKLRGEAEARFEHADIQAHLIVRSQVAVGEEFEMHLDFVNVGRKPALLVKVKKVLLDDFKVLSLPPYCGLNNGTIEMKNKEIGPFQVNTAKLELKILKAGTFTLSPQAVYEDDLGETKTWNIPQVTITASPTAPRERVKGKISSGTTELDQLLFGGIPENYAVALTSSSTDEKELLIERFLEAGATSGEVTFHLTADAGNSKVLAERYPSYFYLFVCNLQADAVVQDQPNVFKLKGIENLTEIDISLTKAFRKLDPSEKNPKRICIEILSDVLLQHHAINTRRWLSALIQTLKSKGFTILAILDQQMHPPEEAQAVLGLFDGEIKVSERETAKGTEKILKIKRLYNQKYQENEIVLTKEKLSE